MATTAQTLTIGMAHHSDFDGVYFTVQSLRLFHPEVLQRAELIVVDNSPGGEPGKMLQTLVEDRMRPFFRSVRYIPMTDRRGTSQTRNRIFAEATSDAVLCMDCHVLLTPGSLAKLLGYYDANPDSMDLLTGPLLTDQPGVAWTHFDNVWRGHMWGVWGVAWHRPGSDEMFSAVQHGDMTEYRLLSGDGSQVITEYDGEPLPQLLWPGHEKALESAGFVRPANGNSDLPLEIPAQGLGLFTCRKSAWLGFNEHFRGFGGEEFYIHEKYRQAGRRNLCLPWLQWLHRFARPGGPKYSLRIEDRIRNYIIGHQELGLSLDGAHSHFLQNKVSEETWQTILSDPVGYGQSAEHPGGGCGSCKKTIEPMNLEQVYEYYAEAEQSDFSKHFPKLRELAAQCEHVTEFGSRDYGVIALLAGQPKTLRSYNSQADGAAFWKAEQLAKSKAVETKVAITHDLPDAVDIEETDLLFYDPARSDLFADLERHLAKIRRFIVVHDTDIYGIRFPNGRHGLKLELIRFMHAHPEWTVVYSTTTQYGLMVLSKNPDDKPKRPSVFAMGPTFVRHMAEYAASGMENVSKEQLEKRLEECWLCDLRTDKEQCSLCGCGLLAKAKMRVMRCDANKWDAIDAEFQGPVAK